ncbi:MAG: SDR family NAD(P)-dependent oxidoreductase, partial [Cyclobacteriaceae bacterium]
MSKLCLVIGVGPGMGLSIARKFASQGFAIAQMARRSEALETYKSELGSTDVLVYSYPADVGDPDSLGSALTQLLDEHGTPEVMIYNVSVLNPASPSALAYDDMLRDFKINVGGALIAAQAVMPGMKERKSGSILITGGGLALKPYHEFASLSIGKAGVRSLCYSLAQELKPHGIHVATITINGMIEKGSHFDPDKIAEVF